MFGILILTRLLFVASMVFIIGYVFGSFSKNILLTRLTKAAVIVSLVLFIFANIASFGFGYRHHGRFAPGGQCGYYQDSTKEK